MSNTNNLFQIPLPEGWKDTTIHTFQGPLESGVQHNLVVTVDNELPAKISVEAWAQKQLASSQIELPGFVMMKEQAKVLASEEDAYEVVYRYCPVDGKFLYQKQLFVIVERKGYTFTASFSKKTLKTLAHDVDAMIEHVTMFAEVEEL